MNRVAILMGAGFSIPLGMPSTDGLSAAVRPLDGALVPNLFSRLESTSTSFNFEVALHAVEALLQYFSRPRNGYPPVLATIFGLVPDLANTANTASLTALRLEILTTVQREITSQDTNTAAVIKSKNFINGLSLHFALRCFTLNYDTTIDDQLNWNDGFDSSGTFSRRTFRNKQAVNEPLLCHLHGAVNYGYAASGSIGKFPTPAKAVKTYAGAIVRRTRSGAIVGNTPLVSGLNKLDKINSTPYSYYYASFVEEIRNTPRLVIIGYGFTDEHVNYWLGQHKTIHGKERRVVLIADGHLANEKFAKRLMRIGDETVMLVRSRYPVNSTIAKAIEFHLA